MKVGSKQTHIEEARLIKLNNSLILPPSSFRLQPSVFILPPSSFRLHPSSLFDYTAFGCLYEVNQFINLCHIRYFFSNSLQGLGRIQF